MSQIFPNMSFPPRRPPRSSMDDLIDPGPRGPGMVKSILIAALALVVLYGAYFWFIRRVVVGPNEVLVVLKKNGTRSMHGDQVIIPRAPDPKVNAQGFDAWRKQYGSVNGILEEVFPAGTYFKFSPFDYQRFIYDVQTSASVPNDKVGIVIKKFGQKLRANIEVERDLTNKQKTITAVTAAKLEEALKEVDVARETVASGSNVKVANIAAEGAKKAAEIDAQRDLEVAKINLEIAQLESKRTQILGKAQADVTRMKSEAEARGAKLLVDAFGSPQAYNLYTFARHFEPKDLRLIFAGPGTFWTDLKSFEQVGASQIVEQSQQKK